MGMLFTNRYLDAAAKSIILFGCLHNLVLVYIALRGRPQALNVFSVLSFDALIPALGEGALSFILSYVFALAVYALVFFYLTRPARQT